MGQGNETYTYQLKDDHITYAYAYPTPEKANFAPSPNSPTTSPVIKETLTPAMMPQPQLTYKPTFRPSIASSSPRVFVNEVADKGDFTPCQYRDWVELYNDGEASADISGWRLHDNNGPSGLEAYVFPTGSILSPKSYKVFCQGDTFQFGINGYVTCRYYSQPLMCKIYHSPSIFSIFYQR